jgi:acyl-CoA reductase-like NAD-dependent aldehyde dehydrogenase
MPGKLSCVSPIDGHVFVERPLADAGAIDQALSRATVAQRGWGVTPLAQRQAILSAAVDAFVAKGTEIAEELTRMMGRPVSQTPSEIRGFEERARYMIGIAQDALAPLDPGPKTGFKRYIRHLPLGVVAVIAPWNYPYLTSVNAVIPALAAGNAVILKHSHQTPLCAERMAQALTAAGLPEGVFQVLHMSHDDTAKLMADARIAGVCFTGSVDGGHAVQHALSDKFSAVGLELGGKDPAYVRKDANLAHAIENLVDGAMFNSGQSCCGIERIYVDERLFDDFVAGAVALTRQYRLGDPLKPETTLGPMVRASAATFVRGQIDEAVSQGATALIDPKSFAADAAGTPYLAPQILIGVDHAMRIMNEETFGPAVGIMKVRSDEEAIRLMNDSRYGLTAAIWTEDVDAAERIGAQIETGTVFMNRCDYLDPALAWTGVKDTGRGCTLSALGYQYLTRPQSFHLRLNTH